MNVTVRKSGGSELLTMKNDVGLSVTIDPYGAAIYEISYLGKPLTVAPKELPVFEMGSGYHGKCVGRIAGRVKDALLTFEGQEFRMTPNEGPNCLHGGPKGLSYRKWGYSVNDNEDAAEAVFETLLEDGSDGLPGNLVVEASFILYAEEPRLRIEYAYRSDRDTVVNLTQHTYFNLGGEPSVEGHILTIKASKAETYREDLIPLGMAPVTAPLDFREGKPIGKDIDDPSLYVTRTKGYDHCYLLDPLGPGEAGIILEGRRHTLEVRSSYPAVQIFSSNYPKEGMPLTDGREDCLHSGLAIEPVFVPGDFGAMAVKAGKTKKMWIEYEFAAKGEKA
jgi:aldose 1-epimerase